MKKKLVLAFLLAGTLSMSSVAYASEGGQTLGEVTKETVEAPEAVAAETESSGPVTMESVEETTEEAAVETTEETPEDATEETVEVASARAYTDGDAVDLTKDELITKLKDAAAEITSVKSELIMDMVININIAGDDSSTGMQMDMTMSANMSNEEIFEPYASHQSETMAMSIMGQTGKQVSETYIREENGEQVKYEGSSDDGSPITDWDRTVTSGEKSEFLFSSENLSDMESKMELNLKDQKAVDSEGTEYYVLESAIDLSSVAEDAEMEEEFLDLVKSLQDSLGTDMELPGELTVDFYINASDFLPSEMTIDMSGMKGDMGETAGEGTSAEMEFTTMVVSYRCSQYNAISEIAYPEDLPTEETSGEEPEAIQDEEVDTEEVSEAGEDELVSEAGQMVESAAGSLAEELGVKGIQETTDTSVTFTDKGSRENPAAMNEMGKVYLYNAISDQYEQVGLTVTGITDGDEATEYVDQLLNAENSYYSFPALKNYEEYRIVNYDLYLPSDFSNEEYGVYAPSAMMNVVSKDDDWLTYNDQSYYAATYGLYEDSNSYHPGDTVHCQCVIVMPKDLTEYELEFGPYGLDYFYVAIQ